MNGRKGEGRWDSRWRSRWRDDRRGGNRFSKSDEVFVGQRPPQRIQVYLDDWMKQSDNVQTHISDQSTQSLALDGSRESLSADLDNNPAKRKALIEILTAMVKLFSSAAGKGAKSGRAGARITRPPGTYVPQYLGIYFLAKDFNDGCEPNHCGHAGGVLRGAGRRAEIQSDLGLCAGLLESC
jgi:hypothetical protein